MTTDDGIHNPTQRLYDFLTLAKSKSAGREGRPIREVWAEAFDVSPKDIIAIFHNLALLDRAFDWTKREIEKAGLRQKNIYTRNFERIHQVLNAGNMDEGWTRINQLLNAETMADLLYCADRLADVEPENTLSNEEMQDLVTELDELFQLFETSELEDSLRVAILDLLETSRQMMADYRIRGSAAIKEIIELALGKLMTKRAALAKESQNPTIKKLFAWLVKLDNLYSKLTKYAPLLPGLSKLLLEQPGNTPSDY